MPTTVSASNIKDAAGNKLSTGTITFTPCDTTGKQIAYRGEDGQRGFLPVPATVTNGAFTIALDDVSLTNPQHICFKAQVYDNSGRKLLDESYLIQPTGSSFSFDAFVPNHPAQALIQVGPTGESAYEYATAQGFSGTEAEWVASLKGDTGSATASSDMTVGPTSGSKTVLSSLPTDPGNGVVADSQGFAAQYVDDAGVVQQSSAYTRKHQVDSLSMTGDNATLSAAPSVIPGTDAKQDKQGLVSKYTDDKGVEQMGAAYIRTLTVDKLTQTPSILKAAVNKLSGLRYEMNYITSYGQSLSIGYAANPAISTSQLYDSLMFAGGVQAQHLSTDPAVAYASLIPLVEATRTNSGSTLGAPTLGETPVAGMLDTLKAMILSENGLATTDQPFVLIGSASGQGSASINALGRGSAPNNRLLLEVTKAKAFADAAGKTFGVPAIAWLQGESDAISATTQSTYVSLFTALVNNLNADIKAITGQTEDVQFVIYQTFSNPNAFGGPNAHAIACGQLQVAQALSNVHVATPCYPIETATSSDAHLSAKGSRHIGGYFGKWIKRVVLEGKTSFRPLEATSFQAVGNSILLTVSLDDTPLVIDTTNYTSEMTALANYGFALKDASGTAVSISVALAGQNRIRVTAASAIATGYTLTYGASPDGTHGGWGNIRDNQGAIDTVLIPGTPTATRPLHNWLRVFSHTF